MFFKFGKSRVTDIIKIDLSILYKYSIDDIMSKKIQCNNCDSLIPLDSTYCKDCEIGRCGYCDTSILTITEWRHCRECKKDICKACHGPESNCFSCCSQCRRKVSIYEETICNCDGCDLCGEDNPLDRCSYCGSCDVCLDKEDITLIKCNGWKKCQFYQSVCEKCNLSMEKLNCCNLTFCSNCLYDECAIIICCKCKNTLHDPCSKYTYIDEDFIICSECTGYQKLFCYTKGYILSDIMKGPLYDKNVADIIVEYN
jgi:hypothetical protein